MSSNGLGSRKLTGYGAEGRNVVSDNIALLDSLPIPFLSLLLRELITYDWKFPAERREIDRQIAYLDALSPAALQEAMEPFARIRLSADLQRSDWVNEPVAFAEKLSAELWSTHQIDAFRSAAVAYMNAVNAASVNEPLPTARLAIVVIGQGVRQNPYRLFRKLRRYGTYFGHLDGSGGMSAALDCLVKRANRHPAPFAHWYLDGGKSEPVGADAITLVSYAGVAPVRSALLAQMRRSVMSGKGAEALRSELAAMRPEQLGLTGTGAGGVLNRFQISLLTEGSGTQIFSTTFVQWGAREALRRAEPLTLVARFAPRQRDRSMEELFSPAQESREVDPQGSLIDADMGAYYTWINQQRLPHADKASFVAWFENHGEAVAIGPAFEKNVESKEPLTLAALLQRAAKG